MLYDPPYPLEYLKAHYPALLKDPVHVWRATTGIELIHEEPTKSELERIWANWNRMSRQQKRLSDEQSLKLFGITNHEHYLILSSN